MIILKILVILGHWIIAVTAIPLALVITWVKYGIALSDYIDDALDWASDVRKDTK